MKKVYGTSDSEDEHEVIDNVENGKISSVSNPPKVLLFTFLNDIKSRFYMDIGALGFSFSMFETQ